MFPTRILLVDDEQDLVWAVRNSLLDEGYEVLTAYNGAESLALAHCNHLDLVILDIIMPQMDGLQVCRQMRQDPALAAIPILFLTVRAAIEDRIKGLNEGGDDYLSKPFDLRELKARIRALLRRSCPSPENGSQHVKRSDVLRVGPLTLDSRSHLVRVREKTIEITPFEFHLLHYLMAHAGEVFTSRQLLQQVWGYPPDLADLGLVRWHVKNLRAKIEPNPSHPSYIRTIGRHGYLMG